MKVTEKQQLEVLKEIFEELDKLSEVVEQPKPDEFTAREYEDHANRSYEWTRRKLNELCEKGILEKRLYKNKYLYRPVGILSPLHDADELD